MEMKAWVLEKPMQLELKNAEVPAVCKGQVLISIEAASICNGSDPGIFYGYEAYPTPLVFGHEAAGVIAAVGQDVTEFKIGDRVFCWCAMGSFAEFQIVTLSEVAMFKLPDSISDEVGSVMELVIASARALMKTPADKNHKKLLICGLGPSGLILVQYARKKGFEKIVGVDLYESRRKLSLVLGADEAYDPADRSVTQWSSGDFDVAVDMMGDDILEGEPTFTQVIRNMRKGATMISYGHPMRGRRFDPYIFQQKEVIMHGPEKDLSVIKKKGEEAVNYVAHKDILVEPLISDVRNFMDLDKSFKYLLEHPENQIKLVFKW
jgi:threonine dehydrogenase-like Zn-dependent dehydrogenase